jgi:hypothetical protein
MIDRLRRLEGWEVANACYIAATVHQVLRCFFVGAIAATFIAVPPGGLCRRFLRSTTRGARVFCRHGHRRQPDLRRTELCSTLALSASFAG